jgi:hypothetical protein
MHPIPFLRAMVTASPLKHSDWPIEDRGVFFLRLRTVDLLTPRSTQFVIKISHRSLLTYVVDLKIWRCMGKLARDVFYDDSACYCTDRLKENPRLSDVVDLERFQAHL